MKCGYVITKHSIERLLCLDVRKIMLSPISQPVVRPLYNGGRIVLQGVHHYLLSMLVDTLTQINTVTTYFFCLQRAAGAAHTIFDSVKKDWIELNGVDFGNSKDVSIE